MRIAKRKKEEAQPIRALIVTADGSRPDRPTPCAQAKTSCEVIWSGVL